MPNFAWRHLMAHLLDIIFENKIDCFTDYDRDRKIMFESNFLFFQIIRDIGNILRRFCGNPNIPDPDYLVRECWTSDEFTLGAYSFPKVGSSTGNWWIRYDLEVVKHILNYWGLKHAAHGQHAAHEHQEKWRFLKYIFWRHFVYYFNIYMKIQSDCFFSLFQCGTRDLVLSLMRGPEFIWVWDPCSSSSLEIFLF